MYSECVCVFVFVMWVFGIPMKLVIVKGCNGFESIYTSNSGTYLSWSI